MPTKLMLNFIKRVNPQIPFRTLQKAWDGFSCFAGKLVVFISQLSHTGLYVNVVDIKIDLSSTGKFFTSQNIILNQYEKLSR